jgi:hypothetical protein
MVAVKLTISKLGGSAGIVISRAVNDSLSGVRTEAVKRIGGKVMLKAAYIRQTFMIKKASIKDLTALVETTGKPVPLIKYSARQIKAGVSVKVLKVGGRKKIPHAFIATMDSGHTGVFWRQYTDVRKPVKHGFGYGALPAKYTLPIKELYGPRVPDVMDDPEIMQPVMAHANERLQARLNHHVDYALKNAK